MRRLAREACVRDALCLSHCPVVRTAPYMQPKEKRLERRRKYVEERRSFLRNVSPTSLCLLKFGLPGLYTST